MQICSSKQKIGIPFILLLGSRLFYFSSSTLCKSNNSNNSKYFVLEFNVPGKKLAHSLQAGQIMSFLRCLFMQALQKRC
jgi:hypothetical protein